MSTVMKFGGSILSSGEDLHRIAKLVKERRANGEEICLVVSALKDITDSLIAASEKALKDEAAIERFLAEIRQKHFELISELGNERAQKLASKKLKEKIDILEKALYGINYLGELSERSKALICTFGERLSAIVIEAYLSEAGVKAKAFDADEAGIITDTCFGSANPLMDKTRENVKSNVGGLLKEKVAVVTGYFGADEKGNITCFGRGGSDFSAGIIANALDANALELWKDVGGFMSADPKPVPNAKLLESISYEEAEELGYFGAKILHPRTVVPLREKKIKAVVKNILRPEKRGTIISEEKREHEGIVKSIATKKSIAAIYLQSAAIVGVPGALTEIFSAISNAGISVDMVSTSEVGVSITIDENDIERAKEALNKCRIQFDSMVFDKDVGMIGVIGEGMRRKPGIAGGVFGCLGKAGINVEMISQGSSEINLSFVVRLKDVDAAVKAIHKEFME